jgi:alkylresorcinol/alkylpyrone synthase
MIRPVGLLSLGLAQAPIEVRQDDAIAQAETLFQTRFPELERLLPVFRNAGIRSRQVVRPVDWYLEPRTWPERTEAYLEAAGELFADAAEKALAEAGLDGAEIDAIVTVSSTGIATPSLEARAMGRLRFRSDALRVPVFGLGCAGGATGLALATRLAASQPGWKVLFVTVEVCSLAFRLDEMTGVDVVAAALFGDGAAACVLRSGDDGFARVEGAAEHTWPDTLDVMGWRVDPQGFGVIFAQSIPPFARSRLRPAMVSMLQGQGLELDDVDRFVCHPGGAKVVEALETALGLDQGSLDAEREVLADHGNMSAPTVLFVLDRLRRRGLPRRSVLTALGPGFTASTVTLAGA